MRPQTIQIFSLTVERRKDRAKRYRVKWRIDGHDFSRSIKAKAEADNYRSTLVKA